MCQTFNVTFFIKFFESKQDLTYLAPQPTGPILRSHFLDPREIDCRFAVASEPSPSSLSLLQVSRMPTQLVTSLVVEDALTSRDELARYPSKI